MDFGGVKITGRALLAPMAGYTGWPFRRVCRQFGAALTTTEVVKARELVMRIPAALDHVAFRSDEHPIACQILSADPGEAGEAAALAAGMGFDLVDLNMGCPKHSVIAEGMGGGLMGEPEQVERVVTRMCREARVPVTVKMRSGLRDDRTTAVEIARRCEAAGAAAVCVHPRFARGASTRPPDWSLIAEVKRSVSLPVIGNGGIRTAGDALRMLRETECDAVLIATAAIRRPWTFAQINGLLETGREPLPPPATAILAALLDHYAGLVEQHGERRGTVLLRKQACHYVKHLRNGKRFNESVARVATQAEVMAAVDRWLRPGIG